MALGIPEFLLVLPEKYLKFGPDLSSSHCRQSFKLPSGLLNGSLVTLLHMQTQKHLLLVLSMLYAQIVMHCSEKPIFRRHSCCHSVETIPSMPHLRVESVRFCLM
ncbi:hypothetical protein ACHWQZ_G011994 [Mnemiopsis leidyi]